MDVESPASPGVESPASPTPCVPPIQVIDLEDEVEPIEEEPTVAEGSGGRAPVAADQQRKAYSSAEWGEKYRRVTVIYETFMKLTSMGDVTSVYRRPIWVNLPASELIVPASDAFYGIPASRNAILGYVGLLIHENAHQCFSKQENPQYCVDYSSVETAAITLMRMVEDTVTTSFVERSVLEVLSWCCSTASELSQQNAGRLAVMNTPRAPESLLELFKMVASIAQLIKLIDSTINVLLAKCPDECMTVLFDASRHGNHFNWIWLHIASTFPGSIVDHLFTVGADQFKAYVEDIKMKERNQVSAAILAGIHEDYNVKFISLSEVFNFLTRRSNTELEKVVSRMIKDSLDSNPKDGVFENLNFVFFFKLVTCSVDTLRFLITQNSDAATPANFFRGIRQLMSVDQRLVLSTLPYMDFAKQMVRALDVHSLSLVFSCVMQMALDPLIFSQFEHQDPGVCRAIREKIIIVVEEIVALIVRMAHSKANLSPIEYPPIGEFAAGKKLQFLVDAAISSPLWAGPIIRYLHAVSVSYGEAKAGEIVARFIVACCQPDSLSALIAFLTTIVPFFCNVMRTAYESLAKIMRKVDEERGTGRSSVLIVLNNLRILLEWEQSNDQPINVRHFGLYPDAAIGVMYTDLFYAVLNESEKSVENGEVQIAMDLILAVSRLIEVTAPYPPPRREDLPGRLVKMQVRYAYKMMLQLAAMQRIALSMVSREHEMAISVFEEFRNTIFAFVYKQFSPQLRGYEKLFLVSFLTSCIQDASNLFGDSDDLVAWKYELTERVDKLNEVEEAQKESFLDAIQSMPLGKRPDQLAHSGVIGKGARHLQKVSLPTEDALHRAHVFLDAIRTTCLSNSRESNLEICKLVADVMTEALCHDALGGDFLFQDWDIEKDFVSRNVEISKRLDSSWISQGLMEVVAENPPCLWFMLPVIKAELATIMVKFENAVDKSRKPTEEMLERFDRWLYIVRTGDILSERFEIVMEMIPHVSCYEGFLLLIEIWRHFQRRGVSYNSIQAVHNAILKGEDARLHITMDGNTEMYRLILQKNIADLGHLFPMLCMSEPA
ncbi:hypothetical protein Q1695_004401 [Nippostrongylus brasiliensis]|nr:hypothetical protein Q1695_004401 [Nippostrongylus brasiliensis]